MRACVRVCVHWGYYSFVVICCGLLFLVLFSFYRSQYISSTSSTVVSVIVQELCESRGGRPGLSILTSLLVSVDVKNY